MTDNSKTSLSRRTVLLAAAAVPAWLSGAAKAATLPPSAVAYQESPKDGKRCDGCKLFVAPASCKSVSGAIAAGGWCKLWVKA